MKKYIEGKPCDFVENAIKRKRSVISIVGAIGGSDENRAVNAVLSEIYSQRKSALVVSQIRSALVASYSLHNIDGIGSAHLAESPNIWSMTCKFDRFIEEFSEEFNSSEIDAVIFTMGERYAGILKNIIGCSDIFDLLDRVWVSELVIISVNSSSLSLKQAYRHAVCLINRFEGVVEKVRVLYCPAPTVEIEDVHYRFKVYNLYEFINSVDENKDVRRYSKLGSKGENLGLLLQNKLRIYD